MPDLHDLLTDAAASPRRPLDGQAVVRAAEGRLRRRRQLTSGIAAVTVSGLLVGVALNLPTQDQAVVLDDPTVEQEGDSAAEGVVDGASGRFERVVLDGVELWRHAAPSGDDLEAEVAGVLEHVEACGLQLRQEETGIRHPVVWPDGTTLTDADPVMVRLPIGTTVTVGQHLSGGGGYLPHPELFPEGCTGAGETAVFNASMPVMVSDPADTVDPADPVDPDATSCIPDDVGDAPAIHDIVEVCVATGPQAHIVASGGQADPEGPRWEPGVAITIEFARPDAEPGDTVQAPPRTFTATATTDGVPNDEAGVGSRDGAVAERFGQCGTADDWAYGTIDGTLVSLYGPQSCFPPGTHELTISSGDGADTVTGALRFTIPLVSGAEPTAADAADGRLDCATDVTWEVESERDPEVPGFETVEDAIQAALEPYRQAGDTVHIDGPVGTIVRDGREVVRVTVGEWQGGGHVMSELGGCEGAEAGEGEPDETGLREDERALLDAFVQFARDPSQPPPAPLRWADSVSLHLADGPASVTFTPDGATGPVWSIEAELFRAYTGPFNALTLIADTSFPLTFGAGSHPHCASPPVPAPAGLQDLRRVWTQPEGTSSCIEWFTVDLFLDDDGAVTAVSMDLWEP